MSLCGLQHPDGLEHGLADGLVETVWFKNINSFLRLYKEKMQNT